MRPLVDPSTIVLVVLALVLAAVAYLKDPGGVVALCWQA